MSASFGKPSSQDPYSCKGLELFKPLPDGRVWAAVLKVSSTPWPGQSPFPGPRIPEEQVYGHLCNLPVRISDFEWTESAITKQLGVPLKWAPFNYQSNDVINPSIEGFFFDGDPDSSTFASYTAEPPRGHVAVVRADGLPWDDGQQLCMNEYLTQELASKIGRKYHRSNTKEDREHHKYTLMRKLTPEAFHSYWVEWQRRLVTKYNGNHPYLMNLRQFGHDPLKIKSPVEITLGTEVGPSCGTCGNIFGEEGKGLLACSRCKIRRYCGTDCQKEDWKIHKVVCGGKKKKRNPGHQSARA